jgi:DNA-binding NtrC family response regulator
MAAAAEVAASVPRTSTLPIPETISLQKVTLDMLFRLPATGGQLEEVELSLMRQAVALSKGNQTRAAGLLGISRDQLRYRMKKIEEAPAVFGCESGKAAVAMPLS